MAVAAEAEQEVGEATAKIFLIPMSLILPRLWAMETARKGFLLPMCLLSRKRLRYPWLPFQREEPAVVEVDVTALQHILLGT